MTPSTLTIRDRFWRRLVRSGARPGFSGVLGRCVGRVLGWPLPGGAKLLISNPKEYIQAETIKYGVYEPNLAFFIGNLLTAEDAFLDVGANIGLHSLIAASTGARVISVEPLPRLADRISASLRRNGWTRRVTIVNCALGSEAGTAVLHVARRDDDGSHSLLPGVAAEHMELLTVAVQSLDCLIESHAVQPRLIKVDVEGYEAAVLDGAKSTLTSNNPPVWMIETGDRLASQLGESAASVLSRFRIAGYELWQLPERGKATRLSSAPEGNVANYVAVHGLSRLHDRALSLLNRLALDAK